MIRDYPQCLVLEDVVYEHIAYEMEPFSLPRISRIPGMWERTVSIHSAGKLFSCTGVRLGWCIGPAELINCVQSYNQYNSFCLSQLHQQAVARTLEASMSGDYFREFQQKMIVQRNRLIDIILESPYDFYFWVPPAGYFLITSIQRMPASGKYTKDADGSPLTRDFQFCFELANEKRVVSIPCSDFFDKQRL